MGHKWRDWLEVAGQRLEKQMFASKVTWVVAQMFVAA